MNNSYGPHRHDLGVTSASDLAAGLVRQEARNLHAAVGPVHPKPKPKPAPKPKSAPVELTPREEMIALGALSRDYPKVSAGTLDGLLKSIVREAAADPEAKAALGQLLTPEAAAPVPDGASPRRPGWRRGDPYRSLNGRK